MGFLKRIIGIVLTFGGFVGFLYYTPPTVLQLVDSSSGTDFMNLITSQANFLIQPYENMVGQMLFGFSLPLTMLIICGIAFIVGLFLI